MKRKNILQTQDLTLGLCAGGHAGLFCYAQHMKTALCIIFALSAAAVGVLAQQAQSSEGRFDSKPNPGLRLSITVALKDFQRDAVIEVLDAIAKKHGFSAEPATAGDKVVGRKYQKGAFFTAVFFRDGSSLGVYAMGTPRSPEFQAYSSELKTMLADRFPGASSVREWEVSQ